MLPRTCRLAACFVLLSAGLLGTGGARADTFGLRVDPNTWETQSKDSTTGLSFSISSDDLTVGPSALTRTPQALQSFGWHAAPRNASAWADWRPFNNGWRTAAGLVWRQSVVSDRFSSDSDSEAMTAVPFVGFGWSGNTPAQGGWRLSAEVGAYMANTQGCADQPASCKASSGAGLRLGTPGDGMRLTPYLTFGASFMY